MINFDQNTLKNDVMTCYLSHSHRNSELRPRMNINIICGPRRDRGGIPTASKYQNICIFIVSKHYFTVRLGQVKLAATPPQIETAGRRLFVNGYFVTMGTTDFYGLGTVLMDCCYYSWFLMGGDHFKGGQIFRLFDPNR